jgi:hypothetical protein
MAWKDNVPPPPPTSLVATQQGAQATLRWTRPMTGTGPMDRIRQYAIYRFEKDSPVDLSQGANLWAITPTDTTVFVDKDLKVGHQYTYVVTALDRLHNESSASNPVMVQLITSTEPGVLVDNLLNAPNPFRTETEIRYNLLAPGEVRLSVQDMYGREVARLVDKHQPAGAYTVLFRADNLSSGVYLATLIVNNTRVSRRMLVQP